MNEAFENAIREYIAFVNQQVGVYMDALAGFAGHHTRVERQVHRVNRRVKSTADAKGQNIVVWASYEDPTKPDVIHNRIIRASDYIAANAPGGSNEQQHARAVLVFLYAYWEDEARPRLAASKGAERNAVRSDVMGDLRILRHAILHSNGILAGKQHRRLTKLGDLFRPDQPIHIPYEGMHQIFVRIKQDCARLLFEALGIKDAPVQPEEMVDLAIQRGRPLT